MTEADAVRYIISRGWKMVEPNWFCLSGKCDQMVCVETAFCLQKRMENAQDA